MDLRNLAYLGDAVWELYVRELTAAAASKPQELHKITTARVNAQFQTDLLATLEDILTPEESELARRARNLPVPVGRKNIQSQYRQATAFEALIGWWYLNDKARLEFVKEFLRKHL